MLETQALSGPECVCGGEEEDRTPDLRIANAALSQLSYPPPTRQIIALAIPGGKRGQTRGQVGAETGRQPAEQDTARIGQSI